MYRFLLFDADETLFDFSGAEHAALSGAMEECGMERKQEYFEVYSEINLQLWKKLELGQISRQELLESRFVRFFRAIGWEGDAERMRRSYQERLGGDGRLLPGALALCRRLSERFELYLVTNGVARTQRTRLAASGLQPYLDGIFISEELGWTKPQREFFEAAGEKIPGFCREEALVIGDSLSSDILGGNYAGIDTCWYNQGKLVNTSQARPTYVVEDYDGLCRLLEEDGCKYKDRREERK